MLVLLILIEENAEGNISLDSLVCEISLLVYLFPHVADLRCEVFFKLFNRNEGGKCGDRNNPLLLLSPLLRARAPTLKTQKLPSKIRKLIIIIF